MKTRVWLCAVLALGCATTQESRPAESAKVAPAAAAPAASADSADSAAKPSAPGLPAEGSLREDGDVTEANVAGMHVIVKRVPTAEVVAGTLAVKGGVRNWDATTAGIEQLALNTSESGGTEALDKDAFARKLASMGSFVGAGAGTDYSAYSFKSLERSWEETFGLMTDVFLHPRLPESELELVRTRQLQALKREQEQPDSRLGLAAHKVLFRGHPYEHRAIGTLETVKGFTREQVAAHLTKLRETGRLVLVIVGNVDPARVVAVAKERLGGLPRGSYQDAPLPPLNLTSANLTVEPAQLPTNYITGVFTAPSWKDPQFAAAMVAISALRYRLFEEVRTKRNLSYAPGASLTMNSLVPRGSLYVTATDPNTTIKVMLDEARKLAAEPLPEKEFQGTKEVFRTGFLSGIESTDEQAGLLLRSQIYGGDWRLARLIPERVKEVTPEDVQAFAKKHVVNLQMIVLGDPAKLDEALFKSL